MLVVCWVSQRCVEHLWKENFETITRVVNAGNVSTRYKDYFLDCGDQMRVVVYRVWSGRVCIGGEQCSMESSGKPIIPPVWLLQTTGRVCMDDMYIQRQIVIEGIFVLHRKDYFPSRLISLCLQKWVAQFVTWLHISDHLKFTFCTWMSWLFLYGLPQHGILIWRTVD